MNLNSKSDSYEALMFDVITNAHRYIPKCGDAVLDLGAHFGVFSLYCAARGCDVVALEPTHDAYLELLHTAEVAKEIGRGSIIPVRRAVWSLAENNFAMGFRNGRSTAAKSMIRFDPQSVEYVDTISLESAMDRYVTWQCVKFDIEGAEREVLTYAGKDLLKRIKFLTLELHNDILSLDHCKDVDDILRSNFSTVDILPVKVQGKPTDQVCAYYCWR